MERAQCLFKKSKDLALKWQRKKERVLGAGAGARSSANTLKFLNVDMESEVANEKN